MIRILKDEEINPALALVKDVYYKTEYINDTEEGRLYFEKEFLMDRNIPKNNEFYGYFIENQLIGVVGIERNAYIKYLFVDYSFEHKGIGKSLLTFAFQKLKAEGFTHASLDSTVYGIEFYKRMGLKPKGDRVIESGMSYIPMEKEL